MKPLAASPILFCSKKIVLFGRSLGGAVAIAAAAKAEEAAARAAAAHQNGHSNGQAFGNGTGRPSPEAVLEAFYADKT